MLLNSLPVLKFLDVLLCSHLKELYNEMQLKGTARKAKVVSWRLHAMQQSVFCVSKTGREGNLSKYLESFQAPMRQWSA